MRHSSPQHENVTWSRDLTCPPGLRPLNMEALSVDPIRVATSQVDAFSLGGMLRAGHPEGISLLSLYYQGLKEAFPDDRERPSQDRIYEKLCDPHSALEVVCYVRDGRAIAGAQFQVLTSGLDTTFGVTEFLWVSPEARNLKLGSSIMSWIEEYVRRCGGQMLIGEFHDPHLLNLHERGMDQRVGITPEARLTVWKRWGYQQFNAPYLCPPVVNYSSWEVESTDWPSLACVWPAESDDRSFGQPAWTVNCTLGVKQLWSDGIARKISRESYLALLHTYWDSFSVGYRGHKEYANFIRAFDFVTFIPVISLGERRTFSQELA